MVQVLNQDSFHSFMRSMIYFIPWSWIYFYAYVGVAYMVLMNLVTAIIVENALAKSRTDHDQAVLEREMRNAEELKELLSLFEGMDVDGSGTLSWEEFRSSFEDEDMRQKWLLLDFHARDCAELF